LEDYGQDAMNMSMADPYSNASILIDQSPHTERNNRDNQAKSIENFGPHKLKHQMTPRNH